MVQRAVCSDELSVCCPPLPQTGIEPEFVLFFDCPEEVRQWDHRVVPVAHKAKGSAGGCRWCSRLRQLPSRLPAAVI